MKNSQVISIEQKYGKYLFDKKLRPKKLFSNPIPIKINEEINIGKKNFETKIEEKKKIIQIIQSFDDPLSPEQVTLENLSFISDIKTPDSQFTIQLKEDLPKIRHESIKSDFLFNPFINPNYISNDINIIDFKKNNYFIEPLLNNYKNNNIKKNIKIINNDNDILENINKNTNEININEEQKKKDKEIEKEKEKEIKEYEDEEIIIKKKNIIIKALIYFNRDSIVNGIENFKKRMPDLNKSKFEEDNKFEKNVYVRIEDRIREILNKCKYDKLSQLRDFEKNYLLRMINFQKKSINYKYICIKGIVIGLLNIINDWIGKEYLKSSEEKNDYENGDFILEIYEKYETIKKICFLLEKDFIVFLDDFKEENKLVFKLEDILADIFWDYVFRIKEINIYFTNNYNNEKINKKTSEVMNNIIEIIFNIDLPYKNTIGEILKMNCIKQENIYLMDYVIKYKKSLNKNNNSNNTIINIIEKDENILHNSSSCDKILNNKINNIEKEENQENNDEKDNNNKEEEGKEKENINKINNEENINGANGISEDISTNDCNNIDNSISNDTDGKKIDLSLEKSLSMDANNNKLSDKDPIDKVVNYILYGDNEKKKQKKKHRKRKKNKNNASIIEEKEKEEVIIDPVVEEYKNYINDIYKNSTEYIKKIKPKINEDWINSISTSIDE